ncbi:3-hydroxybutyryl-CoA dehydrogenase [Staphylococcus coagulans]|uniref:6-phosphogluconate dehydrogenase, decarboxylating n=1 Tax=Staphylococcus coagulans TaxID=74706 RepID=A0A9X0PGG2_9STAP|nr:3-hydroxyacyl-CoA dehydrogenase [Staphylococcus coagulans]MBA8772457.1 3-hydroxyacyl-CoA dehydrogenase [Staphylococcus coagulans]MBA8776689.1 3-hydroxyacyl-CoA dehydrogenase [Staphylococcus coagulans]PNZ10430.1 3-hydroxybutyryl-CoA dehydrogenase [Staphylococcus coagulans]
MDIKNVTIIGAGVLGSQIAFQVAFHGYNVILYDINEEAVSAGRAKLDKLVGIYGDYFNNVEQAEQSINRLTLTSDLNKAVADADLMIESVPEVKEIKIDFYQKVAKIAPEKTIFATNSSTMLPSDFRAYTGRPEKFLALHFANEVWKNNTAEVMGHSETDRKYEEELLDFAEKIGMLPIHVKKEQPGYIVNALLVPLLHAAELLYANDIGEIEDIDRAWMAATGSPAGPFAMLDVVGLSTAYNIAKMASVDNSQMESAAAMLKKYVDAGKLGTSTGEGFYKYPNPTYKEFFKNAND